jgi:hypothetical protein
MQSMPSEPLRTLKAFALILISSIFLTVLTGCGSTDIPPMPVSKGCVIAGAQTAQVPILFTSDAGLGSLFAFNLGVNSITLTDACGTTVTAFTGPVENIVGGIGRIELTHVNGVSEPLALATVPEATYTAATVLYSAVDVAFPYPDDSSFNAASVITNPISAKAELAAPITVDGKGTAITFDTLLTTPIVLGLSQAGGPIVSVTPAFTLSAFQPAAAPTNDRNGKANIRGLVNSVAANQFIMGNSAGLPIPIATSAATVFQGIGSLAVLPVNVPANVDVNIQSDGSLLATRVEVENTATVGSWVGPLAETYPTGMYQDIEPRLWQQANNSSYPYQTSNDYPLEFQFTANTIFQRSGSAIDLTDLPFTPHFASFSDVALGQGLSIDWSSQQLLSGQPQTMAITAALVPRTFSGTITSVNTFSNYTAYTLTLDANDFMHILSNTNVITAYTNAGTQLEDGPIITSGAAVNMHGLLYSDSGTLRLVADQVRLQQKP